MKKHAVLFLIVAVLLASCAPAPTQTPTPLPPKPTPIPASPTPIPPAEATPTPPTATPIAPEPTETPAPAVKRVVLIIAHENFQDHEYAESRAVLEDKGFEITVASSSLETATGGEGTQVQPDILVSDIVVGDYDAIVFIGGMGCTEYWDAPDAHRIAQEAVAEGKVLAAICAAPVILARAGVLQGKRATVANSGWGEGVQALGAGGATYTGAEVERDGLIITASGPPAARQFGETIAAALEELQQLI